MGINLVVALGVEAAPLVERYRLQLVQGVPPFPLFVGDGLRLIVSGMGRVNAASAVAWLAGTEYATAGEQPFNQVWLNLGIGGSGAHPQRSLVVAGEVAEAASGRCWCIPPADFSTPVAQIVTVDRPQADYDRPVVYEMEASGFLAAARRIGQRRRVHCAKVISDGPESPIARLDGESVGRLIAGAMAEIETLLSRLSGLRAVASESAQTPDAEVFLLRWEFSVEQICRLQRLLRRALRAGIVIEMDELAGAVDAGALLRALEAQLVGQTMVS
ncbi:MAG: hypothetical protein U9Q71_01785 [Pseudomonadota bacterium]|nr:hypothetical protein [Pseudomonadota bacterium]